jgi:SNF2 family DNA or RNA helicase
MMAETHHLTTQCVHAAAQVVFCKLSPLQLKLYNAFLSSKPVQALLASTATDPDSKAAAKARRKSAKASKAAAAIQAAPIAAAGVAGAEADEAFQQQQQQSAAPGSRRTSASAAAAAPVSRHLSTSAAAVSIAQQQQQQQEEADKDSAQQPAAKEDTLAPLVAITALKKLCCHPDLIWEMLNKHKVQAKQKAKQQVGPAMFFVEQSMCCLTDKNMFGSCIPVQL